MYISTYVCSCDEQTVTGEVRCAVDGRRDHLQDEEGDHLSVVEYSWRKTWQGTDIRLF